MYGTGGGVTERRKRRANKETKKVSGSGGESGWRVARGGRNRGWHRHIYTRCSCTLCSRMSINR